MEGKEGAKLQLLVTKDVGKNDFEGAYVLVDNALTYVTTDMMPISVESITYDNNEAKLYIYLEHGTVLSYEHDELYSVILEGDILNGHILVDDQTPHFLQSRGELLTEDKIKELAFQYQ